MPAAFAIPAITSAVSGVFSAGFMTVVQPAASAGANCCDEESARVQTKHDEDAMHLSRNHRRGEVPRREQGADAHRLAEISCTRTMCTHYYYVPAFQRTKQRLRRARTHRIASTRFPCAYVGMIAPSTCRIASAYHRRNDAAYLHARCVRFAYASRARANQDAGARVATAHARIRRSCYVRNLPARLRQWLPAL
jgi:hypothetical protein